MSGVAYRKLKATREREERKCVAFLRVFREKKYVDKRRCKDEDAECSSEIGGEEHGENMNMVETNIKIKIDEELPAGINVVKEIEGDNDDVPKEKSSSACSKDRYEYEEGTDKVTRNKEQVNIEIAVFEDIEFWPRTCSMQLLVDLVKLGSKHFQNKDEPFARTVKTGKIIRG